MRLRLRIRYKLVCRVVSAPATADSPSGDLEAGMAV